MALETSKGHTLKISRWITKSFGSIDNLELIETDLPPPAAGEVRISVRVIGLNFADVFALLGLYSAAGEPPFTPGFEASGVIESIGTDVSGFNVGDRVVALLRFGAYATAINVQQRYVRHLQADWSFLEAASFPAQALTAYYATVVLGGLLPKGWERRKGDVFLGKDGGNVLVHSVAGGVGLIAGEIIAKCGGTVVGTVGRTEKIAVVEKRLGLPRKRVIVRGRDEGNFFDLITEKALGKGKGFDLVLDSVGGKFFDPGYKALNVGGRYVIYGSASMMPRKYLTATTFAGLWGWIKLGWQMFRQPKAAPLFMISENKTISGFNLIWLYKKTEVVRLWDELLDLKLSKPLVGKEYKFKDAKRALKFFQSGGSVGKICLVVSGEHNV